MALTWNEKRLNKLTALYGNKKASGLNKKYELAFPPSYQENCSPDAAAVDIEFLERVSATHPLAVNFYLSTDNTDYPLHLRLYQWQKPTPLSDILPMLENMGLRTFNENPYKITLENAECIWISDFAVTYPKANLDIQRTKALFEDAFIHLYLGLSENDGFNKLVLGAALSWREIAIVRMYAKYLRQTLFSLSQSYIEKALINNTEITKNLIELFDALHNPNKQSKSQAHAIKIEQQIIQALDNVTSLDEDRIIRRLLDLIKATLRTNYYQTTADKQPKHYISIKLNSASIPDLPLPLPLYEIFVYSPRFEAIHLRKAKVARGGLRWSERAEDFRTEVLGLMKAQTVKNAIIVPSGAKGGFVLKAVPAGATREVLQTEVVQCYQSFIRGLLDITDNIKNKIIVPPKHVVCYDKDDPYLVVAADKGTATFSDIANSIAAEYNFWLGDAFASGGSAGYDHKKMGITARGAWESIKRHFRELNIDLARTDITVVGIGDMSGDVFGNGMLYSDRIKLVAAFDHRHIFLDPDPDPKKSYIERKRLFNLPISSWENYSTDLISKGGGVYKRSLKSITLSKQIKNVLGIEEDSLTPNDLVRAILKAPVDLLYNGGIGTYVKSTTETQADVGDRANEYCRINGAELRCKAVGEGGNLGFTQLGRIEYALQGGLIYTDFIDNSGGVDCSDHEVNLKILLDQEVQKGRLTYKKRNELLASLTQEMAELVLHDNFQQALVLSFSAYHAKHNMGLHQNYLNDLESQNIINRKVEFLPTDKQLTERKAAGLSLTRPELAVLLAYSKIHIKQALLNSNLPEDKHINSIIETAFPWEIRKKYKHIMQDHPLARDIIATQLSNKIINQMGFTFIYRIQMETGASIADIVRAYLVSSQVFDSRELQKSIESLGLKIPLASQYDMLYNVRTLLNLASRWFLYSGHLEGDLSKLVEHFAARVKKLEDLVPTIMSGHTKEYLGNIVEQFTQAGIPKELGRRVATYRAIYTALNIVEVATQNNFDLEKTAKVYFIAGEKIGLLWFRDQILRDSRDGHWNVLARLTLRDELDLSQRALTYAVISKNKKESDVNKLIDKWMTTNHVALDRWHKLLSMLTESSNIDYTMFFIAIRELIAMITSSERALVVK